MRQVGFPAFIEDPRGLHLMVGLPGSGKSTWAAQAPASWLRLSPDEIRYTELGVQFDPVLEGEVWRRVYRRLENALGRGRAVVVDATHVTRRERRPAVDLAVQFGRAAYAYWSDTALGACLDRNDARRERVPRDAILRKASTFERPACAEGFAVIRRLHGGDVVCR